MNIIAVQYAIEWEEKAANHRRVMELLEAERPAKGAMVVLPEMFATGFSMDVATITETGRQETHRFLMELAQQFEVFVLAGVVTTGSDGRGRNEAVVYSPAGREISRYQKMHPFTFGTEALHYTRGEKLTIFEWGGFRVCPLICYDLRFPEVFRDAAQRGADLFVVIANWPFPRDEHWVTLLRARAIENQAYVVGVNRCGRDPKHAYPGRSMVIDPKGQVIVDAGADERLIGAEIEPGAVAEWRRAFPALADIHPDYAASRGR